ncbi:exported hypothetical protein [Candidatus Accumulibacter aalborgensis]|uniref:Uncharacterized protein n=1 Tax=Candidatus Accumulibacter aalborgensis TaxID=1860102 RepID=A0A1A8XYV1_9PROT|nr:exported hypothetical protein [Candidatus Accumulibacter aalborgensis]
MIIVLSMVAIGAGLPSIATEHRAQVLPLWKPCYARLPARKARHPKIGCGAQEREGVEPSDPRSGGPSRSP